MSKDEKPKSKIQQLPEKGTAEVVLDKNTPEAWFRINGTVIGISSGIHDAVVIAALGAANDDDTVPNSVTLKEVSSAGLDLGAVKITQRGSRDNPGQRTVRFRVFGVKKKK